MMDTINKKYNIEITVLSPLSIGAGAEKDWVKGVDFVVKEKKMYLLNLKKILQTGIEPYELSTLFAQKDNDGFLRKIENKLNDVSDIIMDMPPVNSNNDIKSFIKNELTNKPVVPGSSLKGAIRSVILEHLLRGQKPERLNEKNYFGDSSKGDELMRFFKFSDTEFEKTALVNTNIFNLRNLNDQWLGGWKFSNQKTNENFNPTGFNTLYEVILPDEKGVCSIMISDIKLFNKIERNPIKEGLFSINELFNIINIHTKRYINKEIAFFEKYSTDKTDKIVQNLEQIKLQIPDDNSVCILKMSAGSGFHSITGDWQYKDYLQTGTWTNGKQKYKSRKVAIYGDVFSLMGFVKLRNMSDEEFNDYQDKQEHMKQQNAVIKQQKQEKIRREQENIKLEREQKMQEEAEKQKQIEKKRQEKEQAEKAEQERLAGMSPDDREKVKYEKASPSDMGTFVNASLIKEDLTVDFYKWLKNYLESKKLWTVNVDDKKNKWVKRCLAIEEKLK